MPCVNVSGITMYYEIHGEGMPLVLLPGMGTEITSIANLIELLARNYQVIAIDNRGTGRSGKPDTPWSIEDMADDTIGVLDAAGIPRAHILGISMGSMVAMTIAAKFPERVNGLVLHASFHRIPFLMKTLLTILPHLPGMKKKLDEGTASMIFGQKYPPTPASYQLQGAAVSAFDGRKYLGRIRAPALVINGSNDRLIPASITKELVQGIAGSRLVRVEGDHTLSRHQPELLSMHVAGFLQDLQ